MGINTTQFTSCGRSSPTDDENGASRHRRPETRSYRYGRKIQDQRIYIRNLGVGKVVSVLSLHVVETSRLVKVGSLGIQRRGVLLRTERPVSMEPSKSCRLTMN
jgi:hypothetical protein